MSHATNGYRSDEAGKQDLAFSRMDWIGRLIAIIVFFGLIAKHKEIGVETDLFFHSYLSMSIFLIGFVLAAFWLPAAFHRDAVSAFLYILGLYVLIAGSLAGERGFKDALYTIANSLCLYWIAASLFYSFGADRTFREFRLIVMLLMLITGIPAVLIWLWPMLFVDMLPFSVSFINRAHGYFGDPTSFGTFCALTLLLLAAASLQYDRYQGPSALAWPDGKLGSVTMLVTAFGLLASGSRMGMMALFVGIIPLIAWRKCDLKRLLLSIVAAVLLFPLGIYLKALNFTADGSAYQTRAEIGARIARDAFRLESVGVSDRLDRLAHGWNTWSGLPVREKIFGCGYNCLQNSSEVYGSSNNGYVDMAVNYGLVFLLLLLAVVVFSLRAMAIKKAPQYSLGVMFFVFTTSCTFFLNWPFREFFNFPFFVCLVAAAYSSFLMHSRLEGKLLGTSHGNSRD